MDGDVNDDTYPSDGLSRLDDEETDADDSETFDDREKSK